MAFDFQFRISTGDLDRFDDPSSVKRAIMSGVRLATTNLKDYIVIGKLQGQVLQRRTGNLMSSIIAMDPVDSGNEIVGTIRVAETAPYGAMQEQGSTFSYLIEPSTAKFLHFFIEGREIFTKRVLHPPLQPRSFLQSALDDKMANGELHEWIREGMVQEGVI